MSNFHIVKHEAAIHSDKFGFERISMGQFEGKVFYYWNHKSDAKLDNNFARFNNFEVSRPITYSASLFYNQNYMLPSNQSYLNIYDSNFESSGYAKPYFSFLRNRFNLGLLTSEAYESALNQFQLSPEDLISPEKFIMISTYRDQVLSQVERQADVIFRINSFIASILKVYAFDLQTEEQDEQENLELLKQRLEKFFKYDVLGGSAADQVQLDWMMDIKNEGQLMGLAESSCIGCRYLLDQRDVYLKVALLIIENLYPIELLIQNFILNERLLSPREYRYKLMISPKLVAQRMIQNAKAPVYSLDTVAAAMDVVKEYLIDNELHSIRRRVSKLVKMIRERNITGIQPNTDDKTIRNWVTLYAEAAGVIWK